MTHLGSFGLQIELIVCVGSAVEWYVFYEMESIFFYGLGFFWVVGQ